MKLTKLFGGVALGALLLTSCGRNLGTPESNLDVDQPTQMAYIELEGETSGSDLRLAEVVDKATGRSLGSEMADHLDFNVRVAIRRGTGTPVYQMLRFTKIRGQKKVYYKGNIQIPTGGTGTYQLSAIILGEQGGRTFANNANNTPHLVSFAPANLTPTGDRPDLPNTQTLVIYHMPYVVDWMNITVSADGKRINPLNLRFKTNGTLLRFRITNNTSGAQTVKALKITTNAFFREWAYDLSKNLNAGNLWFGQAANTNRWTHEYAITPITLQPNAKSAWLYLWVMPNKTDRGLTTDIHLKNNANEEILCFHSTHRPNLGAVAVELWLNGARVDGTFEGSPNKDPFVETD